MAAIALVLQACASAPPKAVDDACAIFREKPDWWEATREAEQKWGAPVPLQLAIVRQESGFREDAKPPRDTLLGIPMWWRLSNAYGFAQVKDETWDWYRDRTGNRWADRDDFEDVADFIGWYSDVSHRTLGIGKSDAFNQYLAYHEGHGGWKRRTYREKDWLVGVARKVERYARTYGEQLRTCRKELEEDRSWWPL
ncbi:MAG: transglycosylase SLT domain-containing protein [Gammaproteobacteria bacterium]|nr:transglycosylase SLT domain-containing protein [Gammaproteobacteria bacterium]